MSLHILLAAPLHGWSMNDIDKPKNYVSTCWALTFDYHDFIYYSLDVASFDSLGVDDDDDVMGKRHTWKNTKFVQILRLPNQDIQIRTLHRENV